ncbi:hypothetical protein [Brachybacterium sp. GPGPB12]|uniref:hypothetical protein n=1 Tax=Brachybacterium sp. GPGPB12 TaxID=3023517 RepID=UPI00313461FB
METLILAAIAVSIAVSLIVIIGRMLVRRREEREQWERDGRPEPRERTPEEKERDRRGAITWGRLVVAVPVVLVLAYWVSR